MKYIPLTKNKFAIVDDEDYPYLNRLNWHAGENKSKISNLTNVYARLKFQTSEGRYSNVHAGGVEMSHLLIKNKNGYKILHKNGDTLDNRKENLFSMPYHTMIHKSRKKPVYNGKKCSSKYKGVYWLKNEYKWTGSIKKDKKLYYLGRSDNENEMAIRYNKKAKELYGDFAYQNKIVEYGN
jgi:hypothetical protein